MNNRNNSLPAGWTGCETYRGFVIATRESVYAAFNADGERMKDPHGSPFRPFSRAQMRRNIDAMADEGRVA